MFGFAYLASIVGMIGAIAWVGLAGQAPSMDMPTSGVGFILVMALQ